MHVRYGNFNHETGGVNLSVSRDTVRDSGGIAISIRQSWNVSGDLIGTSQSDIDAKVAALTTAYNSDGHDIALVLDTGQDSSLALYSADCIGGTKVTKIPSFPSMRDAAYQTFLPFTLVVTGEQRIADRDALISSWNESITTSGGGSRYTLIETLTGRPIKQRTRRYTIYRATQSGQATGRDAYPTPPLPLWPAALMESPTVTRSAPTRRGGGDYQDFTISWSYRFESAVPLLGNPNTI